MPLAGWLTDKVQPKYLIAFGLTVIALSMWVATSLDGDITFAQAAWARVLTAAGLPFLFIPITTVSYSGLPPGSTNQAAGLINVARNLGGSIGVALTQALEQQREQFHHSRLVEHVIPSDVQYQEALRRVTEYFTAQSDQMPRTRRGRRSRGLAARSISRPCCYPTSTCSGSCPSFVPRSGRVTPSASRIGPA